MAGARDGTLWIGTTGGLVSLKAGRLTQYAALSGFFISNILDEQDGGIWATGTWGNQTRKPKLCELRNGSATCYGDDGSFGNGISSLFENADGLWVATGTALWHWKPKPPVRYDYGTNLAVLKQNENSSGFAFYSGGEIRQIAGGKITDYPLPGAPSPLSAVCLLRDRHGALWVGTSRGVLHSYEGATRLITHSDGLSSDPVSEMFEDREGTIWIGTSDGLDSFRETPFASLSGLSNSSIRGVLAARDGSIWIGTAAGIDRWKDGRISVYQKQTDPGLPGNEIGTLFEDERGRIWVQAYPGVARFDAGSIRALPSVPGKTITAIASDHRGGVWLQLSDNPDGYGLVHLVDDNVTERLLWKDLGGSPGAGLVVDPDGGVWTGLFSGGIAHFRAGQIQNLSLGGQNAGSRRVFNLSRERDGALWAATENGLSRIADGRVSTLTTANGLPCNVVHWIIDDGVSSYWLYTACGLLRTTRSELEAWAADPKRKIQLTVFDSADGIPPRGILLPWRPHVTKAPDGRIWFKNGSKVTVIDGSHIGINTLPPPVHIEQITADGKTYDGVRGLHLPPLVRNVTIDYTALSLAAPERVHFRYKLEGQDPDWREVINDREVQYSNLPPRNYRFRVVACNNSGVWNETGDVLDFAVDPAYYQTRWFQAAVVTAFLALLWGLYRYRLHRMAHEYNVRLEERVEERTRIARDLHDTLLQTFQGLMLRFQVVDELLPPGKAKEELQSTLEFGDQAVVEARNAVHDLRSSATTNNDLAHALRTLGTELAKETTTTFRLVVEGRQRDLNPIVRDEIYRIAREALRNADAHAAASHIEAEITYDEQLIRLRVRDDGKGIPADVLEGGRAGHYGLAGMRERARSIGAKLRISSGQGIGTEIEVTVPGPIAYGKPTGWSRLWPFGRVPR
jgi:signal transduction histidine kinase/ligand-binding sensor domain-containing protein